LNALYRKIFGLRRAKLKHWNPEDTQLIVIGHRGAAGHVPENTLRSIGFALDAGVDAVEIDVRERANAIIVLHDETVDRTTSGRGHYKAMSLDDLRSLDAGNGERIPLLHEVVDFIDGRIDLNVEVKEPGIAEQVVDALIDMTSSRIHWRSSILLSSFDEATTFQLARKRGEMRLGILYEDDFDSALARAKTLGAYSLHMPLPALESDDIARAHQSNIAVFVYTVNEQADILRCAEARADGVFSDYPDRVVAFNRGLFESPD
jgi:glycerophosphoryl diester phosphodiesterase